VSHIVGTRTQERWSFRNVEPGPEDRAARQRWVEQGVAELLDVLADVDEQEPVWNWAQGVAPAWFWLRRMGLETAVHRVDAQLAADNLAPVDTEMAVAGVDEHLAMLLPLMGERLVQLSTDSSLHVHCTDAEGEWLVRFTPEGPRVTREHAKGDTALRGTASDLYLFLWNRLPLDRCEVIGDDSLLRRWPDLVRI
jgi:uncharacterized protein (TIGR03083 family)